MINETVVVGRETTETEGTEKVNVVGNPELEGMLSIINEQVKYNEKFNVYLTESSGIVGVVQMDGKVPFKKQYKSVVIEDDYLYVTDYKLGDTEEYSIGLMLKNGGIVEVDVTIWSRVSIVDNYLIVDDEENRNIQVISMKTAKEIYSGEYNRYSSRPGDKVTPLVIVAKDGKHLVITEEGTKGLTEHIEETYEIISKLRGGKGRYEVIFKGEQYELTQYGQLY